MLDFTRISNILTNDRNSEIKFKQILDSDDQNDKFYIHLGCIDNRDITTAAFYPLPDYTMKEIYIIGLFKAQGFLLEIIHTLDITNVNGHNIFTTIDESLQKFASIESLGDKLSSEGKIKYEQIINNAHKICRIIPASADGNYIDDSSGWANITMGKIISRLPMHIQQEYYKPHLRKFLTTRQEISVDKIFISTKSKFVSDNNLPANNDKLFDFLPFLDPKHPEYSAPLAAIIYAKLFVEANSNIKSNTFASNLDLFLQTTEYKFSGNMIKSSAEVGNADRKRGKRKKGKPDVELYPIL